MQVRNTPLQINQAGDSVIVAVGAGGSGVYYGPYRDHDALVAQGTVAAPGSTFSVTTPTWVLSQGDRDGAPADVQIVTDVAPAPAALAAPGAKRQVIGSLDGITWGPQPAALWLPRHARPLPRRRATNVTRCDTLTGVTGSVGQQSIDATRPGLGAAGSIKLLGPAGVGAVNAIVPLAGAPWSFGDGATPTAYLRVWLYIDDSRDLAKTCINSVLLELGTAAGFTNDIKIDIGSVVSGDGLTHRVKSRNKLTVVEVTMIDKDDADMPSAGGTAQGIWAENGTGFAAADWAAITQAKLTVNTKLPADGSAYVQPTVWLAGIERVPLPPYALLTFQNDWPMPDHAGIWSELHGAYGVIPLCLAFPSVFRGTQGSTEMTLAQYLEMAESRYVETGIYANQNVVLPDSGGVVVDGGNNFGGGTATVPGVPGSNYPLAKAEQNIAESQAYFAEYNLSGHDLILGQERKLRDDELFAGGALLRKYASFSHTPLAVDVPMHWPPENPYRASTYMLDITRDFVDLGAGAWGLTANAQARIRRAIKNKEWLRLLVHEMHPAAGTAGVHLPAMRALLDYATAAGRFDGTAGKIVSQSEAMALSRYAT